MPKKRRIIRVTKWLGTAPALAVCANCGREFKVPLAILEKTGAARDYLEQEFERHQCSSPDDSGGLNR